MENKEKILEVKDLVISFKTDKGIVHAVRGVSFDLYKGETLCIVGESGSGKSVTNKAIMGISAKNAIIENGSIMYEGEDLIRVSEEEFHRIRGHKIGMIFQDPLSALNPVMKVGKQIIEATMINNNILKRKYNDLISKELTAYRNNKANVNYNISRLENEINKNNAELKNIKDILIKIQKNTGVLEGFLSKEALSEKEVAKVEEAKNNINSLEEKKNSIVGEFQNYTRTIKRNRDESIQKYSERIEQYSKLLETVNSDSLERQIYENNVEKAKLHLEVVSKKGFADFDVNKLEESIVKRNAFLKELIDSYKKEYKICNPALKLALKISKKQAKIDVKKYHSEIKAEHEHNLVTLEDKLCSLRLDLKELEESLSLEEKVAIHEVIKYNKVLKKKKEVESKKFKEINVSKTVKKEENYKEIPNEKYASLVKEIEQTLIDIEKEKEAYINKTKITKAEAKKMALNVMKEVGIPLPERRFKQYPFEFSGGMRQRIVIAIALTANPEILICDEPTTALDVTIQAQILELINRLKRERNLSCIFITHDLGVVANMADRVAVMYAGKIVEYGLANEVFFDPRHPYTWALLSSIPDVDSKEKLEAIPGTPPDMRFPPKGDAFALRSKYAMAIDFKYEPPFFKVSDTHYAATWLLYPNAPKVEMPKIVKTRIENALKEESERVAKEMKEASENE